MTWAEHLTFGLAVFGLGAVLFGVPAAVGYWLLPEQDALQQLEHILAHPVVESTSDMCPLCDAPQVHSGAVPGHAAGGRT